MYSLGQYCHVPLFEILRRWKPTSFHMMQDEMFVHEDIIRKFLAMLPATPLHFFNYFSFSPVPLVLALPTFYHFPSPLTEYTLAFKKKFFLGWKDCMHKWNIRIYQPSNMISIKYPISSEIKSTSVKEYEYNSFEAIKINMFRLLLNWYFEMLNRINDYHRP